MMCACEETFARKHLPHQISEGSELSTQKRVPVSLGFLNKICTECRGQASVPAPAAEVYGRVTKIKRYYWRELLLEEIKKKAEWTEANPNATDSERQNAFESVEVDALDKMKALHKSEPKYVFSEPSQSEVLKRCAVDIEEMTPEYAEIREKGAVICDGESIISPEEFVKRVYESRGWSVLTMESIPFHALFGVMMWMLIQDPTDPKVQLVGFGDRESFEAKLATSTIWTYLPDDFGCVGYSHRRKREIQKHFKMIQADGDDLIWLFDYWAQHSMDLRQYLWCHRQTDLDRARCVIEIIPSKCIFSILHYLVEDYWSHYLGWPDLLLHRGNEFLFLEVKSSGDRLSQAQKLWIGDNHDRLNLPFRLVKLHKRK
jgi:VRR-NUC domain